MGVRLPNGGNAIFLTATIGGAHSDITDESLTIVYTDTFSSGITVAMPIEEFYTLWMTCLLSDYEVEDVETVDLGPLH
jgi:hypothetical protein